MSNRKSKSATHQEKHTIEHKPAPSQKPGKPQPVDFLTGEKHQAQSSPDHSTSWPEVLQTYSVLTLFLYLRRPYEGRFSFTFMLVKLNILFAFFKSNSKMIPQNSHYLGVCLWKKQTGSFPCLAIPSRHSNVDLEWLYLLMFLLDNLILAMSCPILAFYFSMQTSHLGNKKLFLVSLK